MAKSDNGELNSSTFGSNTSDPNNSILKKVTKRVSGLFPSSLTKWFGPSEGNQSTVRRRESIDDDDEDNAQFQQPPKKRVKQSSDVDFSASTSFTITSTPLVNTRTSVSYERSTRNEAPVANGDDKSDSGDSTSGYSSAQPQQQHKESPFVSDGGNLLNQPSTSKSSPYKPLNSSLNSSRSLFSDNSLHRQRQCLSSRRPSFSASTFGSPSFVDRTLSTKRAVNSPFYSGRTMYGGASAYRRNRIIFPRDESSSAAVKNSVEMKPVKESSSSNDSVNLSKTARRILDTLEHFSTPVLDAKKIPNINRQTSANQKHTPREKMASNKELLVPAIPDLIKMKLKERLQDSTVQVRKVATSSKSILNTEYSIRTVEEPKSQKHVSKMKTKVASVRERKADLDDVVDAPKLPDVKLPITTLPKFDFTLPPPATITPKPIVTETAKPIVSTPTAKPFVATSTEFNFTKPIILSEKPKSNVPVNNFKFSEPINANSDVSTAPSVTFIVPSSSTAPRRKEAPKNNGQNNLGFSLQAPTQFVSGSVMDVLGKPDNLLDKFKPAAGTWECSACMIRNIPSATRCVACETLKEPPKKVEQKSYGFGNQFKKSADKWECGACMIRNDNSNTKCVACTTPKPGSTPVVPTTLPGFGDKFKPPSDTWECSACMIRNKQDSTKCVACETPNPKAKTDTKAPIKLPEVKTTGSGFGDFIKKQQSNWECPSCMVRNPSDKDICACCEAPKPGADKSATTGFKFGIDNAATPTTFSFGVKPADKTTDTKVATSNGPAPITSGFTFGIPAANKPETKIESPVKATVSAASNQIVSITAPIDANKMTFKFGPPAAASTTGIFGTSTTSTTASSFSFGVPASAVQATPKSSFAFGATSTTTTTNPSSVVSTAKSLPTSTIFSSSANKSTMLFSSPTVVAVTTTPASTTSTTSSSTFTFGAPAAPTVAKPVAFSSENKIPQFNFGSGGLPFNPVYPTTTATTTAASFGSSTTAFSNVSAVKKIEPAPSFGGTTNAPTFTFNSNTNNKSEVKPFSFSGEPPAKFSFTQKESSTPLAKAPAFNFGGSSAAVGTAPPATNMFSFNANKTEKPAFGASSSTIFGEPAQQPSAAPQNGGFSFGSNSVPVNFNFGGANNPPASTPAMFGFGSSQAGTGSAAAAPAPAPAAAAPGIFAFGGGASGQPQTQTPTFSPDIKPNFNFTGGSIMPSFSAQSSSSAGAMPQRKIRKAIRRTQPR